MVVRVSVAIAAAESTPWATAASPGLRPGCGLKRLDQHVYALAADPGDAPLVDAPVGLAPARPWRALWWLCRIAAGGGVADQDRPALHHVVHRLGIRMAASAAGMALHMRAEGQHPRGRRHAVRRPALAHRHRSAGLAPSRGEVGLLSSIDPIERRQQRDGLPDAARRQRHCNEREPGGEAGPCSTASAPVATAMAFSMICRARSAASLRTPALGKSSLVTWTAWAGRP